MIVETEGPSNHLSYSFRVRRDDTTEDKVRQTIDSGFQPSDIVFILNEGNGWKLSRLCEKLGVPFRRDDREATIREALARFGG